MIIWNIIKSKLLYTILGVVIATVVSLWGQGILIRPKISVSCGAIDYKIPVQYRMEVLSWKMMMSPNGLAKQFRDKISASLREYGFPEDRIKLFLTTLETKTDQAPSPKPVWKPYEQNIIKAAIAKLTAELLPAVLQKYMELPDGALFFQIDNDGWASANNPHIVIRLAGTTYKSPLIESDNKLISSATEGSELSFDYDRIAPRSKTKGIIWYSHVKPPVETLDENEISISFDRGTVRKKFSENKFFISGSKEK